MKTAYLAFKCIHSIAVTSKAGGTVQTGGPDGVVGFCPIFETEAQAREACGPDVGTWPIELPEEVVTLWGGKVDV